MSAARFLRAQGPLWKKTKRVITDILKGKGVDDREGRGPPTLEDHPRRSRRSKHQTPLEPTTQGKTQLSGARPPLRGPVFCFLFSPARLPYVMLCYARRLCDAAPPLQDPEPPTLYPGPALWPGWCGGAASRGDMGLKRGSDDAADPPHGLCEATTGTTKRLRCTPPTSPASRVQQCTGECPICRGVLVQKCELATA